MAKGLRAKSRRRLRTVRRAHYTETRGQFDQQKLSNKLLNPFYDFKADYERPPNAFVHPEDPAAIFPKVGHPEIMDFRSHKMGNKGGLACVNTFRKIHSENAKKSKYIHTVRTTEMIEKEEAEKNNQMIEDGSSDEEEPAVVVAKSKNYTVDDIMSLGNKLSLSKKKATPQIANKAISKKKKAQGKKSKKSQKIVKF